MQPRLSFVLFLAAVLPAACGGDVDRVVSEVENGTPLIRSLVPAREGPPFCLVPEQEFGALSPEDEGHLFRPAAVAEVPGGLAVLDRDGNEVKIFNGDGSLRLVAGGQGQGPGEFTAPRMEFGPGCDGRLFLTDSSNLRFTWIDPWNGESEIRAQQLTWSAAHVAPDRFVLIRARVTREGGQVESLELVDASFDTVATFIRVPPGRILVVPSSSSRAGFARIAQPLWPPFSWWVQAGMVAACRGDDYRVEVFDCAGNRQRIVVWAAPRLPVTDAAWDSIGVYIRRQNPEDWATIMQAMERPEYVPAVEGLRLDDRGRIWALRDTGPTYATHIEEEMLLWDVIDTDGTWLGTQPFRQVPWYFGEDVCYVIEQRESGAVVVRYRLEPVRE